MFIFEWLANYMNTPNMEPNMEMTGEIELLGILAIGIIVFLLIGMSWLIDYIIKLVKKRQEKKGKTK